MVVLYVHKLKRKEENKRLIEKEKVWQERKEQKKRWEEKE